MSQFVLGSNCEFCRRHQEQTSIRQERPVKPIAITLGDPAGIGPETIAAAWPRLDPAIRRRCLVIGRRTILQRAAQSVGQDLEVQLLQTASDQRDPSALPCLEIGDAAADHVEWGQLSPVAGELAYQAIVTAIDLALGGDVAALVTAPINKLAWRMAGVEFPGHTELIASRCGIEQVRMMLYLRPPFVPRSEVGLGVVHTTLHESLRTAIGRLQPELIVESAVLLNSFFERVLKSYHVSRSPRLAVAALNPHGGEQGLFGTEEAEIIQPAVERLHASGIRVAGPLPCDSLMARAAEGEFDGVVAMYHDQGHIAFKLLNMHRAVNVTLGLPLVRTSAAHGTAFEIAGTGQADFGGIVQAIHAACELSNPE